MPTETMSITRGLREIRVLADRIEKTILSTKFVAAVMGRNLVDGKSQESFAAEVKSTAANIENMIQRRDALKRAIVMSNAGTMVVIAGVAMTVAEAIERKSSIEHELSLLMKLVDDYNLASNAYERMATEVQIRRDHQLAGLLQLGSTNARLADEEYRAAAEAFDADVQNMPQIVDPLNARDHLIDQLRARIDEFRSEVDVVLSESNGKTMITVTY